MSALTVVQRLDAAATQLALAQALLSDVFVVIASPATPMSKTVASAHQHTGAALADAFEALRIIGLDDATADRYHSARVAAVKSAKARASVDGRHYVVWEHVGDYGRSNGDDEATHDFRILPAGPELGRAWAAFAIVSPDLSV